MSGPRPSGTSRARVGIGGLARAALRGRVIWGVVDQGTFGVTSFALSVGVANRASAAEFGAFGISYVVYTLVLGAVEAFTAEVVVVRGSHLTATERHRMLASAAGTAAVFGLAASLVGLAFLLFVPGAAAEAVPPLFLLAPLLFAQDVWRFGFFAAGRPRSAALNDLLWAVLLGCGFVIVALTHGSWTALAWSWSAAGAVCGVVGALQHRCLPRPRTVLVWIREQSRAGGRFAGEYLALYGAGQSVLIWVGLFAGLAQSAGYRGATLLFGPIQIMLNAVRLAITPIVVRAHQAGKPGAAWRGGVSVAICAAALACVWGAILLLLPDSVGRHILGSSWGATRPVLPVLLWLTVVQGCALGAVVLLRVVGAYRQTFRIRLGGALLILLFGGAGATGGSVTAGVGAATAVTLTVGALWWQARAITNAERPSGTADQAVVPSLPSSGSGEIGQPDALQLAGEGRKPAD